MIYTTYFTQLQHLPENIVPVSICGQAPDWYTGLQYKKLAPKYSFFMVWKQTGDNEYYVREFNKLVLSRLTPGIVVDELYSRVRLRYGTIEDKDIALVCYERPEKFCHRHLVSAWLNEHGYPCSEWRAE